MPDLTPTTFHDRISRFVALGGFYLDGLQWTGDEVAMTVRVTAWDAPQRWAQFQIRATGVEEIHLDTRHRDEGIFDIALSARDPLLADFGPWDSLLIDRPLPAPADFFLGFWAEVLRQCPKRDPLDYLDSIALPDWLEEHHQGAWVLVSGPEEVVTIGRALAEAQGVAVRVHAGTPRPSAERYLLQLDETWVVCRRVWLAWDDEALRELAGADRDSAR